MKKPKGKEFWVAWAFMYRKYGMSRLGSAGLDYPKPERQDSQPRHFQVLGCEG